MGEELSDNVADYLENSDKKVLSSAELDLSAVDESKVGSYSAKISYNNKDYPFTVNVIDTTAPECEATDYLYICLLYTSSVFRGKNNRSLQSPDKSALSWNPKLFRKIRMNDSNFF